MTTESVKKKVEDHFGVRSIEVRVVSGGVMLRFLQGNPTLIASEDAAGRVHVYSFPHTVPVSRLCGEISSYVLAQREEIAVL
jgi:hypothetical protein